MIKECNLDFNAPLPEGSVNDKEIAELSKLIAAAQSILHAEVFSVSGMTVSVNGLVSQCNKVAEMYSDDKTKNGYADVASLSKAFVRGDAGREELFENFDMIAEQGLSEMLQMLKELQNYSDVFLQAIKKKEEYDSLKK